MLKAKSMLAGALMSMMAASAAFAAVDPAGKVDETSVAHDSFSLVFTAPIDAEQSRVKVYGPHGQVFEGAPSRGANRAEILIPVADDLPPGGYIVYFTVIAIGGQKVTGASAVTVPEPHNGTMLPYVSQTSLGLSD